MILQLALPGSNAPPDPILRAPRRGRPIVIPFPPEYPAILASPVFAPDRRPGPRLFVGAGEAAAAPPLIGYAALGVVTGRGVASVVMSGPGGAIKTLRGGESLNGWRLSAVDSHRVTFIRGGARESLIVGAPAAEATPDPAQ